MNASHVWHSVAKQQITWWEKSATYSQQVYIFQRICKIIYRTFIQLHQMYWKYKTITHCRSLCFPWCFSSWRSPPGWQWRSLHRQISSNRAASWIPSLPRLQHIPHQLYDTHTSSNLRHTYLIKSTTHISHQIYDTHTSSNLRHTYLIKSTTLHQIYDTHTSSNLRHTHNQISILGLQHTRYGLKHLEILDYES